MNNLWTVKRRVSDRVLPKDLRWRIIMDLIQELWFDRMALKTLNRTGLQPGLFYQLPLSVRRPEVPPLPALAIYEFGSRWETVTFFDPIVLAHLRWAGIAEWARVEQTHYAVDAMVANQARVNTGKRMGG